MLSTVPRFCMVGLARNRTLCSPAAALLIAAGVLFAPARADAGCGDYVRIDGQPAAANHPVPADSERPCHGPHCSNRPAAPAGAPASPPTDPKQPGSRSGPAVAPDVGPGRWSVEPVLGRPVRIPVAIFHPPRLG